MYSLLPTESMGHTPPPTPPPPPLELQQHLQQPSLVTSKIEMENIDINNLMKNKSRHAKSIESLLEPIRYSMAFLTMFSVVSTFLVAVVLEPINRLQLLAQAVSLTVSLSGFFGTLRRSIFFSSVYALSMLLFLFLQCSYFFVLLKLVQEVNLSNPRIGSGTKFDPVISATSLSTGHQQQYRDNTHPSLLEPYLVLVSHNQPHEVHQSPHQYSSMSLSASVESHQAGHSNSAHHTPPSAALPITHPSPHVRHISLMLHEELSHLSLLTVPMLAWLPPSLFMETAAVLLLLMQALAAGCFLYALRIHKLVNGKMSLSDGSGVDSSEEGNEELEPDESLLTSLDYDNVSQHHMLLDYHPDDQHQLVGPTIPRSEYLTLLSSHHGNFG